MSIFNVTPVTVADYRLRAWWKLPRFLFDYVDGGANDELTAARKKWQTSASSSSNSTLCMTSPA